MSDEYYRQRARQRTRRLLIAGGLVLVLACAVAGVSSLFYDACTGSFDRDAEMVVRSYAEAVRHGDARVAQECWEHETFYDLEAGCSEICLARVYGAAFEIQDVVVGEAQLTAAGRANRLASMTIACAGSGESHTAEIVLDGVADDLPWRHWSIVHSTLGGTVADPWCK